MIYGKLTELLLPSYKTRFFTKAFSKISLLLHLLYAKISNNATNDL